MVIHHTQKGINMLNRELIKSKNISKSGVVHIKELHNILSITLKLMGNLNPKLTTDLAELKHSVTVVESLEYMLQCAWGFTQDSNYHSWWFRVPHCKCPVMDNYDYIGLDMRVYNCNCPLHGTKLQL